MLRGCRIDSIVDLSLNLDSNCEFDIDSGRWVIILAWVVEQSTYCNVDLQFQITRHRSDLNLEKVSRIFQIVLIAF